MRYTAWTAPFEQIAQALYSRPSSAWGAPTSATMPCGPRGDLGERSIGFAQEPLPEQEVLRRIAGHGELGEDDEVRPCGACLPEPSHDAIAVRVEVADDGVDLGKREPHRFSTLSL